MKKESRFRMWDFESQKMIRDVPVAEVKPKGLWFGFTASPDGKWASMQVSGEPSGKIYDAASGKVAATLPRGMGGGSCAFLPKRDILLVPSNFARGKGKSSEMMAYDIQQKTFIAAFRGQDEWPPNFRVSADGKVLAVQDGDGISLWDLAQLK